MLFHVLILLLILIHLVIWVKESCSAYSVSLLHAMFHVKNFNSIKHLDSIKERSYKISVMIGLKHQDMVLSKYRSTKVCSTGQ